MGASQVLNRPWLHHDGFETGLGLDAIQAARSTRIPSTSFIRRCWYPERGCGESSACSDLRALFDVSEKVDELPAPGICKNPKYIVTGSRSRHGLMETGRLETLEFPGEEWYKCCVTEGKDQKLLCEAVKKIPHGELLQNHNGYCGMHKCIGSRDRCLVVDRAVRHIKAKERGECPSGCSAACDKETQRLECINLGTEPEVAKEGEETPLGPFNESEKYDVFSFCMPSLASMLPLPAVPQSQLLRRQTSAQCLHSMFEQHGVWSSFLS